ncbi:MAG: alpha/beta fold hydrolase [Acidimicrobiia bacterium]
MTRYTDTAVSIAWEETGEGSPLLLIHGLGYARWGWGPMLGLLAERFRVIIFDNRGIGGSSVPAGPYTIPAKAGDAAAVLDGAGVDRAHVIGTSLGGMIAQELTLAAPQRVDRLVLMCTTPGSTGGYPVPDATAMLLARAATWDPMVALRRFVENALSPHPSPALVEEIMALRLANPQEAAGWAAQAAAGAGYDGGDHPGAITAPTLVMSGTADSVVDYRNSEVLAGMIPGATLQLVPDAGHLFFWERPETVTDAVLGFLT